jgi:flagellar biosynthesis anti-sigma factor FlgM
MRIDLNPSTMPQLDRSSGSAAANAAEDNMEPGGTGAVDVANLSTGSDAVQQLREHLDGIPDVRQERVNGLRQAISQGTFQVSPGKIADAMLAESRSLAG